MTMKEIANALNVSTVTVSKALNDKPDISVKTKRRVLKYAEAVGYSTNGIARSLRTKKTNTLGAIITNIRSPLYSSVLAEIEKTLYEHGYSLIIVTTQLSSEREKNAVKMMLEKHVDGFIITPVAEYEGQTELFEKLKTPHVALGREVKNVKCNAVIVDDHKCGYMGARRLIDSGRKRILFLNGAAGTISCDQRQEGYEAALQEAGIPFDPELIRHITDFSPNAVYDEVIRLLKEKALSFDSILTYNDNYAFRTMHALIDMEVRVPEDVAVITIDGSDYCNNTSPQLSSVSIPIEEISRQACQILLEEIRTKNEAVAAGDDYSGPSEIIRRILKPVVVDRQTV